MLEGDLSEEGINKPIKIQANWITA